MLFNDESIVRFSCNRRRTKEISNNLEIEIITFIVTNLAALVEGGENK